MHLAERGIIGSILYYWFSVIMCIKLWRTTQSPDKWLAVASVGILAGMLGSIAVRVFHSVASDAKLHLFLCNAGPCHCYGKYRPQKTGEQRPGIGVLSTLIVVHLRHVAMSVKT